MATIQGNQVKLNDGKLVTPQQGGWYDGQQYWGGALSKVGQINASSDQIGAGQDVSAEVNRQTSVAAGLAPNANQDYINAQRAKSQSTGYNPGNYGAAVPAGMEAGSGAGTGIPGGVSTPAAIDLPSVYDQLYQGSGIKEQQDQYSGMEKDFIDAKSKINDNPFLSEATRVGRVAKLEQLFNERTANVKNDIATKKADVETKLQLQLKQFDINSQAAKQALDQFNTLLSLGALDNASGEDIANLTRSTGISSGMIQNAIGAQKNKNRDTQVITNTADNGVVTVSVIDKQTGEVVSKQSLGAVGNATNTGSGSGKESQYEQQVALKSQMVSGLESVKNSYGHVNPQDWQGALASWISRGGDATDFVKNFQQYADPNRGDFTQAYGFVKPGSGL